jgi:hypothetical protein
MSAIRPEYYNLGNDVNVFENVPWACGERVLMETFPSGQGQKSPFFMHDVCLTGHDDPMLQRGFRHGRGGD